MQYKLYFLFAVLLLIVKQSASIDAYNRIGTSALDYVDRHDDDDDSRNGYEHPADDYLEQSLHRRQRYPPATANVVASNYRSRPRGPSSYENSYDFNDYRLRSRGQSLYDDTYDSNDYRSRSRGPAAYDDFYGSNDYRSRSRGPAPYDDFYGSSDRSQYGPNHQLLNVPGSFSSLPSFESGPYENSGPGCYSLLDSQYPLFSDICGAVPQARYSLPNAFGHVERWQIAQILTLILGPATPTSANPMCTRSLRLLLCPLLFPSCQTRYEAPPVLPCKPFCRAVKSQCPNPSLDLLPCDLLPPVSDLCPIDPTPYSSLLSRFGGPPSPFGGPLSPFSGPPSPRGGLLTPLNGPLSPFGGPTPPFDVLASPFGSPSSPFAGPLSPFGAAPSPFGGAPSPFGGAPSPFGGAPSPFGGAPSPFGGAPSPFGGAPSPIGGPSSLLSSLMSLATGESSPAASSSAPVPSLQQYLNSDAYLTDSLNPILVDFPPLPMSPDQRQPARYFRSSRSVNKKV